MKLTPSKLKKISILGGGILLFIVILNVLFGFFRFPLVAISPFEAIPENSAFIVETEVPIDLFSSQLNGLDSALISNFESITSDQKPLREFLATNFFGKGIKTLIVPQIIGATKIDFLYVLDGQDAELNVDSLRKEIDKSKSRKFNFMGTIYQSLQSTNGVSLFVCKFRNLLLVSKYAVLVEDGIRQLNDYRNNINFDEDFKKIYKKESQITESKLYINFNQVSSFLASFLDSKNRKILNAFPNFVSWLSVDLKDFPDVTSSGHLISPEVLASGKNAVKLYEMDLLKAIPDNTGFLYVSQNIPKQVPEDSVFRKFIAPWISNEWSLSILNPRTSADRLLILQSRDIEFTQHYLDRYGRLFGELKSTNYQTFPLRQLADDVLLQPFLNELQLDLGNPYYAILDDLVVFTKNRQSLELVIDKFIVGQNILLNNGFVKYVNGLSDQCANALLYIDGADMRHVLKHIVAKELHPILDAIANGNEEPFTGGFEFYNGGTILPFNIDFEQKKSIERQTDIVWRVAFPANVKSIPEPLWNPETEEYEIAVQDDLHNLYLLNNSGEIIWKRALKEPLLSEIHQVDYQEDGSRKMLFNTANKIYLIDRRGKDIGNYPMRLQSPASNGICVVDFKHNLQYKLFLACENGHAYGFTKEGNPVFGWNPKMKVGKVLQPFQHFQYNGKDYLVILNDRGGLATYNSLGESAFPKLALGASYINRPNILSNGNRKEIALSNDRGQLKIVDSKGSAYNLSLKNNEEEAVKLTFANIAGDTKKDLVALSKNKVTGYYQDNKQLKQHFEVIMNHEQDEVFEVKSFKDSYSYFGTLCKSKKQINLFDAKSTLHKDFPLAGTTPFKIIDLYKNSGNVLLVGLDNAVYAYQIAKTQ